MIQNVFLLIVKQSVAAGYLIAAVIVARALCRKAPRRLLCVLWLLVGVRLLCPFSLESAYSLIPAETTEVSVLSSASAETAGTAAAAAVAGYRTASVSLTLVGAYVWAAVAALLLVGFAVCYVLLKRRLRTATPMRFHGEKLYQSDGIRSPFLFGVMPPRIYVPYHLAPEDLTYIVLHENAHCRRGDHLVKAVAYLLLSVYWFHPLVWAAYLLLGRDLEMACDERVLRSLGEDGRSPYARALLRCAAQERRISACPIAFGEIGVKARVKKILNYRKPSFWVTLTAAAVCAVTALCFMTTSGSAVTAAAHPHSGSYYAALDTETIAAEEAEIEQTEDVYTVWNDPKDAERYLAPSLYIDTENSSFTYSSGPFSSYLAVGTYTIDGNVLTGESDDGEVTIAFEVKADGTLEYLPEKSRNVTIDGSFTYIFSQEEQ